MKAHILLLAIGLLGVSLVCSAQHRRTFNNPLLPSGADPWIIQHGAFYYYMQTMGDRLKIWKTRDPAELGKAISKTVWLPPAHTAYSRDIWAPELHFIQGKWYIYFAADDGHNRTHRIYVLENASGNPLEGQWIFKGKLSDRKDKWAIDPSVFQYRNHWYLLWAGWKDNKNGQQDIYIARMKNPWTIEGDRVRISAPVFGWEMHGDLPAGNDVRHVNVNEGPEILKHHGDVFLIYSASGCWTDYYALGMLTLMNKNKLLDSASWKKSPKPVFRQSPKNGVYATGHNSFFKSPDGRQYWILYHANNHPGDGCGGKRSPRMQSFGWNKDGSPDFGEPVSIHTSLALPSGVLK